MDRSFQGLLLSLCAHIFFVLLLLHAKLPPAVERPTEITLVEKDDSPKTKAKTFVTETDKKKDDVFDKLKNQADFLSEYTKRVKKQMIAKETAATTRNADEAQIPSLQAQQRPEKQSQSKNPTHLAGLAPQPKTDEGIGLTPPAGADSPVNPGSVGASTISEYIPGVQMGAVTTLNTDQFTYYAFYHRMNEQVVNRWQAMIRSYVDQKSQKDMEVLAQRNRETVIEIILNPAGDIVNSVVHRSSGDKGLDNIAYNSFTAAAPFINPPHGMVQSDGLIHIYAGFMVQFKPPGFGLGGG